MSKIFGILGIPFLQIVLSSIFAAFVNDNGIWRPTFPANLGLPFCILLWDSPTVLKNKDMTMNCNAIVGTAVAFGAALAFCMFLVSLYAFRKDIVLPGIISKTMIVLAILQTLVMLTLSMIVFIAQKRFCDQISTSSAGMSGFTITCKEVALTLNANLDKLTGGAVCGLISGALGIVYTVLLCRYYQRAKKIVAVQKPETSQTNTTNA